MQNTLITIARMRASGHSLSEIADYLKVTEDWLHIVMSSDSYEVIAYNYQMSGGAGYEQ